MGKQTKKTNVDGMIGISQRFAVLNRLITRDLNNNTSAPTFSLYSKDNITEYLTNPYTYEKQLRKAVTYIYGASSHFRRLIQYFTGLSDFAYVVSPYRIDPKSVNVKSVNRNYRKVLNAMSAMNVRSQFPKILTVCLREDTFYGTLWVTNDNITIQQLPSDYCGISTIEGNVLNVTFDFSYFDAHSQYLEYYPTEFQQKYKVYQSNRRARWQELDSPTSFAIKCNNDILDYSIPPFAGILREVYDLEDYKQLKLTKTTLENYANPESFALEGQFRDELFGALESEKVETCWGMDSHYWFWDYDRDASEVYATDVTDWNLYGFPYSMDGDHVVIDFAGKKRMKLSLVPFDEGGQADPISGMFAKITEKYSANDTQWAEKYQTASDTISSMENELGTLRQFKTDTEDAAAKGEREKVFAQFEDLVGVEAFENLREHCTEYAVDVLEEKCYAIRGRNGTAAKFSVEPKSPKLVVEKTSVTPEPYGGVFTEYGIASRNQHN